MFNFYRAKPSVVRWLFRLWPPFWFTGIYFSYISHDFRELTMRMPLRFYNRNLVGTHFGGSLYAMTDPCYMLMMMYNLGSDYYIWDKTASIDYVKPGRGTVTCHFVLSKDDIDDVVAQTMQGQKYLKTLSATITDDSNNIICTLTRTLYIRKKEGV